MLIQTTGESQIFYRRYLIRTKGLAEFVFARIPNPKMFSFDVMVTSMGMTYHFKMVYSPAHCDFKIKNNGRLPHYIYKLEEYLSCVIHSQYD